MKVNTFLIEGRGPATIKLIVVDKKARHLKIVRTAHKGNDYVSGSAQKMIGSVADGIGKFRKRNKKAYKKRQDLFLVNFVPNMLNGLAVPTRQFGKLTTGFLRRMK